MERTMRKILLTTAASGALLLGVPAMAGGPTAAPTAATPPPPAAAYPAPAAQQYQPADPATLRSYRWHRDSVTAPAADPRAVRPAPDQRAAVPGTHPHAAAPAAYYQGAERLMHEPVVDAHGAELGLITDLLIGLDNQVHYVVVEAPAAPYETYILPSERLHPEEGAMGAFFVDLTREQLAELPQYQRGPGGFWGAPPALRPDDGDQ